eukprot:TRINITY_DN3366_c0_g4_i1.p1 TRINITY_DN3366_c0_g4~~TRINITY_DN3366_c0_g4_i1.p1  ORF type:complete len:769 (-),score=143.12 TRINITY_DN3366_c0_g4_i1:405-2711(-)
MPTRPLVNVVWFKCTDLRVHDHAALKAAHAEGIPVVHLYVFDPFWYEGKSRVCGFPKTGPVRARFHLEAVEDLASRLERSGHALSVRAHVATARAFEELCEDYTVNAVFAFREICSEELRIEQQVRQVLQAKGGGGRGAALRLFWGFELYHADDLSFDPARARGPFNSYTAFRKRLEEGGQPRPSSREDPTLQRSSNAAPQWARADRALPAGPRELLGAAYDPALDPGEGKDPRAELRWRGGETAALARVREYLWDDDSLGMEYVGATMTMDPAKSCMRDKAMSKLSPWLAHGCLSPRRLYEEVKRYERERKSTKSTYWITHELIWRDFVRFGSLQAGTSIFRIGGPKNGHPSWRWSRDEGVLRAWTDGRTGFPFVDCFMRELKVTGYCNHMGRECAGWFLIGDLGIDWRMGAEWFEYVLIDYEPTANWFNWTYRCLPAAGRGGAHGFNETAPGQRLQGLEILKWGTQHDPDATYIKRWIPELASLSATVAREPWRLGLRNNDGAAGGSRVSPRALAAVVAMGFQEAQASAALRRAQGDPEVAVALLLGGEAEDAADAEEEEMARAIRLSLGSEGATGAGNSPVDVDADDGDEALARAVQMSLEPSCAANGARSNEKPAASREFQYGVDYPHPIIQPVSLMNTEEMENTARVEQAKRDQQIALAKRRRTQGKGERSGGNDFVKAQWEESKGRWPAETPTSAGWRRDRTRHLSGEETGENEGYGRGKGAGKRGVDSDFSAKGKGKSKGYSNDDHKRRWRNGAGRMSEAA